MKILDEYNIKALSKLIYQTNIMPSGNNNSFLKLSEKLIQNLQNQSEFKKIERIVSSELITTYGLSLNQEKIEGITESIYDWYEK